MCPIQVNKTCVKWFLGCERHRAPLHPHTDAAEVEARGKEYSTFQTPYSLEKIVALQKLARVNMKNNKDAIMREIQNAATRRQSRR